MSEENSRDTASLPDMGPTAGMPVVGEVFAGRYRIERLIGRGGMGMVYLAVQSPLDRQVALKVLRAPVEPVVDPQFQARFLREAEAAARLQHPNTITIHDFGTTDGGVPYIVMEYLEGHDLRELISIEWPFPVKRTLHVAQQVCKSLMDAHGKGMIHRDLKPSNVLLVRRDDDPDFVKVFDFGLVKFRDEDLDLTQAGIFLGSPRYTFPEALDSKAVVDERADIYSTGILIYTMVAGQPPFSGEPMAVLSAHLNEMPRPMCEVDPFALSSPALEAIVARCLRKDPRDRYQSMRDLLNDLRAAFPGSDGSDESLELDPSSARAQWQQEFSDDEERTTRRDLSASGRRARMASALRSRAELFIVLAVLLVAVALAMLRPGEVDPVAETVDEQAASVEVAIEQPIALLEVGVSVYSDQPEVLVSYLDSEAQWKTLGPITSELRERWKAGSTEPWWKAMAEPEQQVLSIRLVSPGAPGRRMELPIVDGLVRFDATVAERADGEPRQGDEARGRASGTAPPPPRRTETPTAEASAAEKAGERAEQDQGDGERPGPEAISPDYKDNPY